MDIDDLSKFIVVAETNNLQIAASQLNVTPGALSKVIKRIESKLNTELFDRVGRNIVLNQPGKKFRQYAVTLVHETQQAISEFGGQNNKTLIKLSGPSLLIDFYLPSLIKKINQASIRYAEFEFHIESSWEGKAINSVATGQMHLALVTSAALFQNQHSSDFIRIPLGQTGFKVVASQQHPLFKKYPSGTVTVEQLTEFEFACPSVSPFCGLQRGIGSDGWRDDKASRAIGYRCNNFGSLLALVKSNLALAFVPDFVAENEKLHCVDVAGLDFTSSENIELVYKPSMASGWLNRVASKLAE